PELAVDRANLVLLHVLQSSQHRTTSRPDAVLQRPGRSRWTARSVPRAPAPVEPGDRSLQGLGTDAPSSTRATWRTRIQGRRTMSFQPVDPDARFEDRIRTLGPCTV